MRYPRERLCRRTRLNPRRRPGFAAAPACAVALVLLAAPTPAAAQDAGEEAGKAPPLLVLERPASVRALALGGSPAYADRDSDLLLFSPGFLSVARGAALSRVRHAPGRATSAMTGVTPWWGGGVGLALRTGEDGAGPERSTETALTAGYGRTIAGFGVGATVTGVNLDRGTASDHGFLVDLGLALAPGPVGLGIAVGGLGWAPEPRVPPDPLSNPVAGTEPGGVPPSGVPWLRFGLGAGSLPVGPLDVAGSWSLTARDGFGPESGGGLEVSWWPVAGRTFTGRVGHRSRPPGGGSGWSFGGAFLGDAFTLEYAARRRPDGGWAHGAALRFR